MSSLKSLLSTKQILIVFLALGILLLIERLFTRKPGQGDHKIISGTFQKLELIQLEKKVSSSFDLYISGYPSPFKIGAGDVSCFNDYLFTEDVNTGDSIIIKLENLSPLRKESVTSIISRNREYIDLNCLSK